MSTPARLALSFVSFVLLAAAIVGCSKKEDEPVVLAMPSATAVTPVKAVEDPAPAATPQAIAPTGSAGTDTAAAPATPPPADAPKTGPAPSIEGCCSALTNMTRDAKLDAVTKSKAASAAGMCNATAPLVKSGKAPRSTALTQIKATMGGSAPSACN